MANNEMIANVRGGALVGAGFGGIIGAVIGWLLGAHMVAVPVIGPVVGQGVLSTALVALVAGAAAGALLGGLAGVFSPVAPTEAPEETTVALETLPVAIVEPAPMFTTAPMPEAQLEAQTLAYPIAGMEIATPDAATNPFAAPLESGVITARPVKVTAPLEPPLEEQIVPLPAKPVKVTAPLVDQDDAASSSAGTNAPQEVLPQSASWVTFDPGEAAPEHVDENIPQTPVEADENQESTTTPLMRVKRRRRVILPGSDDNNTE